MVRLESQFNFHRIWPFELSQNNKNWGSKCVFWDCSESHLRNEEIWCCIWEMRDQSEMKSDVRDQQSDLLPKLFVVKTPSRPNWYWLTLPHFYHKKSMRKTRLQLPGIIHGDYQNANLARHKSKFKWNQHTQKEFYLNINKNLTKQKSKRSLKWFIPNICTSIRGIFCIFLHWKPNVFSVCKAIPLCQIWILSLLSSY